MSSPSRRVLPVLLLAALAYSLAQTAVVPAISDISRDLHATTDSVAWVLSGYLISSAVMTPIMGRLGDMFGKRRMLVLCLALYTAGSVVAALGGSLGLIVAGRVLQGCGAGVFPLCFGLVRDQIRPARVPASIGLLSATAGIGGGLGLPLGGLLVDHASYRWIFWSGALLGLVSAAAARLLIHESPVRHPGRIDVRGAAVLAFGLTAPLLAISQGNRWGWTDLRTLTLGTAGLAVLAGFVVLEQRTAEPLVDVPTLRLPAVLLTNITTLLVGFGMFGIFVLLPQLAQAPRSTGYGFGVSATHAGMLLVPGALIMIVSGPLAGVIGARRGSPLALAIGGAAATVGLTLLTIDHSTQLRVLVCNAVLFVGIGMAFAALPNCMIDAVPADMTGQATGVNALVRAVGSSLGSQVAATILAGSVVASGGHPTDHAYTVAFALSAGVAALAALTALTIPRPARDAVLPVAMEIGAASTLGEPALTPYDA